MHLSICMCVCVLVGDKKRDEGRTKERVSDEKRDRERERFMEGRVLREKYLLRMRMCSHMLAPPQSLQPRLMRLCSRMLPVWSHKISVAYAYRESADV